MVTDVQEEDEENLKAQNSLTWIVTTNMKPIF